MAENIPFTELDFANIKENLKNYLKGQDRFKDYDFEGSNMNVLLDLLAQNTFQNNFYRNMAFSEMFLDTAQLRENAASHAKELNYLPGSRRSSTAKLNFTFTNVYDNPNFITIPRGARFIAQCGNSVFNYVTNESHTVFPSNGVYSAANIPVYEGRIIKEYYTVDGSGSQQYIINNTDVDISSVRVFVRDSISQDSTSREHTYSSEIFGVEALDRVFYISSHFDNLYKVEFGRDRFGREPEVGNVIEIEYRVTKGEEGNGARNFTAASNISGYPVSVTSNSTSARGSERESIEDIRFFAPKSIQVQERAVTKSDYEILLKQRFPNIQSLSVYGGDEVDPPQFGKVIISVDVEGAEGAGDSEIIAFKEYILSKTPLTIDPVFVPAEFMYVKVDVVVNVNKKVTTKSDAELRNIVRNTILQYSTDQLSDFGDTLRQSRLSNLIDTSDIAIVSTDILTHPIIEYKPIVNRANNPAFNFNAELYKPYPFNASTGFDNYRPAISSSTFSINNTLVSMQDDGNGNMIAITASQTNKQIFKRKIGSVDYDTGLVRLSNFSVSNYDGDSIKIYADSRAKDVTAPLNRIITIRPQDISVTINAV